VTDLKASPGESFVGWVRKPPLAGGWTAKQKWFADQTDEGRKALNQPEHRNVVSRRGLLQQSLGAAGVAAAVPYFFSRVRSLADEPASAGDRFHMGQIGCGGQGNGITKSARRFGDVLAVCDVDRQRAEQARAEQGDGKAEIYDDYRRLLDRKDIEVVTIATPDHWHTKIAIEAMQAGKDVYCEKPLTLTIDEGKKICQAVRSTGRVFQVGTQQRSHGPFAQAIAMVRDGRLGKLQRVTAIIGGGPEGGPFPKTSPPSHLNWDMWLGQAPLVDYIERRCHYEFRWWYEYSGGKLTDWGAHHVDIAHWAIGAEDTGPVSLYGSAHHPVPFRGGYPTVDDQYNTAVTFAIVCRFPGYVELIITDRTAERDNGVLLEGSEGRVFVSRGEIVGRPVEELKNRPLPDDAIAKVIKGHAHGDHMGNFFTCVKSRKEPISDVFSHHRAISTCHLANLVIRLQRPIRWDPEAEQILGDEEANSWQSRPQRAGYEIPA
jgi:predicted dehydrogenase